MTENLQPVQNSTPAVQQPNSNVQPIDAKREELKQKFETLTTTTPVLDDGKPAPVVPKTDEIKTEVSDNPTENEDLFAAADNHNKVSEKEWSWNDKTKGEGDKPDWMKKEFKSVEQQARAYNDLVKKFGSFHGAPESYDFSSVENSEFHVHPEAANSKKFTEIGKELNLSQDGFNKILDFFNKAVAPTFKAGGQARIDSRAEIAKLGADGAQQVQVLDQWLKNNFSDSYQHLRGMMKTSEHIKAFQKVRSSMLKGTTDHAIYHENGGMNPAQVQQNLRNELAEAMRGNDPIRKQQVLEKYKQTFKE